MMHSTRRARIAALALGTTLAGTACSSEGKREGAETRPGGETSASSVGTGKIITVEAYSDGDGNYYKPAEFEAHRGDVIRFVLKSGVHNINFLADSNPGRSGLPPASDMLQIPGQTWDLPVTFGKGRYYFQCDPHVALGMKGHVKVED